MLVSFVRVIDGGLLSVLGVYNEPLDPCTMHIRCGTLGCLPESRKEGEVGNGLGERMRGIAEFISADGCEARFLRS